MTIASKITRGITRVITRFPTEAAGRLGPELQLNNDFSTADNSATGTGNTGWLWPATATWEITGGQAVSAPAQPFQTMQSKQAPETGKTYRIAYEEAQGDLIGVSMGGKVDFPFSTSVTIFTAVSNAKLSFTSHNTGAAIVANVSVREVL